MKLKALVAEDTAGDVKKQMSPFGLVVPLKQMNALLVQDTVGNLENILATIRGGEQALLGPNQGTMQVFNLERTNGAALAEMIRNMMPAGSVRINSIGVGADGKR